MHSDHVLDHLSGGEIGGQGQVQVLSQGVQVWLPVFWSQQQFALPANVLIQS